MFVHLINRLAHALIVILAVSAGVGAQESPGLSSDTQGAPVDPQVWADLTKDPEREVTFVVVMREAPGGGPASAMPAQVGLEGSLELLQRVGSINGFVAHYGINVIVVNGTGSAVRFLAAKPEVAEVRAYRPGEPWEVSDFALAEGDGLLASGQITGKVTELDGTTPVAGILVRARRYNPSLGTWPVVGSSLTGADGTYAIGGLSTGAYRAGFSDPAGNYVPEYYNDKPDLLAATDFNVIDGQTKPDINAALAPAGQIAGTVTAISNGAPVLDIAVSAYYTATGEWKFAGDAATGPDGTYVIGGLREGVHRIRFADPSITPTYLDEYYNNKVTLDEADDVYVTVGATTPNIDAALGGYGKVSGTVIASSGAVPLEDIYVDVYEPDGYGDWQLASFDTTDENGHYEAAGLVTRDYRIEFSDALNPDQFAAEFYSDKPDIWSGDAVHVELGLTTENVNAALALVPMAVNIPLASGWNLMSLSLDPSQAAPQDVLAGIAGQYEVVWAYEACDPGGDVWKRYVPNAPGNDLTAMSGSRGYWLDATSTTGLSVTGLRPAATSISLCTGWNLVGYPAGVERAVTTVLAGIAGKYDLVYGYDATDPAEPWKVYDPNFPVGNTLESMQLGWGYWILMNQGATLTILSR